MTAPTPIEATATPVVVAQPSQITRTFTLAQVLGMMGVSTSESFVAIEIIGDNVLIQTIGVVGQTAV
jgi:hypothetical protein